MTGVDASVVMPVRNGARTVLRAVDSILAQTAVNLELIVVDDGSEDDTAGVLRQIDDRRLRLLRIDHSGITAALRVGTASASGEIIARQDADDVSFPARLERQLELFDRRRELVVVGVNWEERDAQGRTCRQRRPFVPGDAGSRLMIANPIFHGAVAFRRGAADAVGGYDPSFRFAQDYDLWLRLAEVGVVWNHDEVLATRYMDGTNIAAVREQAQHRAGLRARARACRRRRNPALWPLLARGTISVLLPPSVKRPVRRLRGQAA
jgi:glycosyltransferase involved in cell wall biosynthesis